MFIVSVSVKCNLYFMVVVKSSKILCLLVLPAGEVCLQ